MTVSRPTGGRHGRVGTRSASLHITTDKEGNTEATKLRKLIDLEEGNRLCVAPRGEGNRQF